MPITIIFESGTRREIPEASEAQPHGRGLILFAPDRRQLQAFDGPIVAIIKNGEEIPWPPQ